MIDHARARELAAVALDFELDDAERSELDAHLDACDSCRAFAVELGGLATELAQLPQIDAPPRVRRGVLAGRPARGTAIKAASPAAAVILLLVVPIGLAVLYRGGLGFPGGGAASTNAPVIVTPFPVVTPFPPAGTAAPPAPTPSQTTSPASAPASAVP